MGGLHATTQEVHAERRQETKQEVTYQVLHGDNLALLPTLADNSIDAIVTDPPYGLSNHSEEDVIACLQAWMNGEAYLHHKKGFMAAAWDGWVPSPTVWRECWRVLKPGGHLLCFAGSRTSDLMGIALRLAGFEIRDQIMFLYGCLSDDTEILTANGWVRYHMVEKQDTALCYNVDNDSYEWQPIQEVFVYDYADTAYRIQSDSTDQLVSRNHRCIVEREGKYVFQVAEQVARQREVCVPVLEDLSGLLAALPVPQSCTEEKEPNLFAKLHEQDNFRKEDGQLSSERKTQDDIDFVCCLWQGSVETEFATEKHQSSNLFAELQRGVARRGMEVTRQQGARWMVGSSGAVIEGKNDWRKQSGMEGGSNLLSETRELQADQVCTLPAGIYSDGAQRWLCDGTPLAGCSGDRKIFIQNGSCPSHQSRSAGQSLGESTIVCQQPGSQAVRASRFTRSTLVTITPTYYEGVVWCVRVPTGAFVARRNGKVFVTGNSGFPKSHNVAKALDKANGKPSREYEFTAWMRTTGLKSKDIDRITGTNMGGHYLTKASQPSIPTRALFEQLRPHIVIVIPAWIEELIDRVEAEREVIGQDTKARAVGSRSALPTLGADTEYKTWDITLPATDAAQQWQGWGSALKPAFEPIWVCRKPLSERTLAANVLKWGVGAINVDATRVGTSSTPRKDPRNGKLTNAHLEMRPWMKERIEQGEPLKGDFDGQQGRWPANVVHDGSEEVLVGFPQTVSGGANGDRKASPNRAMSGGNTARVTVNGRNGDIGSAARFFAELSYDDEDLDFVHWLYTSKASKQDRDEGLENLSLLRVRQDLTEEQMAHVVDELQFAGVCL